MKRTKSQIMIDRFTMIIAREIDEIIQLDIKPEWKVALIDYVMCGWRNK